MSKKVLILGGARFHGLLLAKSLSSSGEEVYVLNRGNYKPNYEFKVNHLIADRNEPTQLEKVLRRDFDAVVDNNAYTPEQVRTVLELVKNRCGHYIFTSSVVAYFKRSSDKPLAEEESVAAQDSVFSQRLTNYAKGKLAAEKEIQENWGGLDYTILRLPNVFGEGDFAGKLFSFYDRLKNGRKIILEEEVKKFSLISAEDAVQIFNRVICNTNCFNKIINACDSKAHDHTEFFEEIYGPMFNKELLALIPYAKMQMAGYAPKFPWGPVMSTELLTSLVGEIPFTKIEEWGRKALAWEINHFEGRAPSEEELQIQKIESSLTSSI